MPSQPSEVLDFLSKFLPLANDWSDDWKRLEEGVRELEESLVFPSAYPGKKTFRNNFDFFLKRLFFYCRFPWLGGKCLIARIGYAEPLSTRHGLPAIVSIPILYAAQVETTLYSPQGSALNYPQTEIPDILRAIRNSSGNVDALFSLIAIQDVSLPPETVIVDVPDRCQPDNIFFEPLLAAAEQIKLFPSGTLARSAVHFLESRRPLFPVWVKSAPEKFFIKEEIVSSSTSSDGNFCFLTTAACRARGLPDDCAVLTAYRRFRDEVLLPTKEGKALVEEYYRIAPDIVRAIENRADSEEIYATMWDEYLNPGYRLVLEQKNTAAKDLYIQLVLWITKKYTNI